MKEIKEFSVKYWKDIINFQSTWWNISVKNWNYLYIKSSGYSISDIHTKDSISIIDIDWCSKELFNNNILSDDDLNNIIEKNNRSDKKSSIETGFHLIIKSKYVIHTHNIYINVLLCSENWEKILWKLFWDSFDIIWFFSPWLWLYKEFNNKSNYKKIIFLKNHGVVIHSDVSFDDTYIILNEIEKTIFDYLKLEKFDFKTKVKTISKYLFPDIIALGDDLEVKYAHNYIENSIKINSLVPSYIDEFYINYIKNMKQEKYRKSLINNNKIW